MKKIISGTVAFAMMVLILASCAQAPQIEMDAATAALEAAKTVEADKYLAAEYNALVDSLNQTLASIEAIKDGTSESRDYKPLVEKLTMITASAEALTASAETRKAEVRVEVEGAIAQLNNMLAENKDLLGKSPKVAGGKATLEMLQNEVTAVEASVTELNTLVANGDYLTALEKVKEGSVKAVAVNEQLKGVK